MSAILERVGSFDHMKKATVGGRLPKIARIHVTNGVDGYVGR
jgi:hypothetical protein